MFRIRAMALCVALVVPVLAACEGSSGGASSGNPESAGLEQRPASSSSKAGTVDVCALLTQDDAAAVARARGLNGAQTAATKYT